MNNFGGVSNETHFRQQRFLDNPSYFNYDQDQPFQNEVFKEKINQSLKMSKKRRKKMLRITEEVEQWKKERFISE
jgi:HD superfamily phosphodiesterase